jgi:putative FmdB family regulatory protein
MPSYEYECQLCKARVELVQSLTKHEPPAVCPSCNIEHTMIRVNYPSSNEAASEKNEAESEEKE